MTDQPMTNFQRAQAVYNDIYEQYANGASFLWLLRSISVNQPHFDAHDLLELEQRIAAQLDGLMTSVDIGWQVCEEALERQGAGEVFTAMVVAMRSHEGRKIQLAVEVGLETDRTMPGLISAMGWLPEEIATPWMARFLNGKEMSHKYLGLATCSVRRHDPGELLTHILQRDDCQQHEKLYARALRLVGELRRQDCMPVINRGMSADSDAISFWSHWSAVLLGHRASVQQLKSTVFNPGPYQSLAIQLVFRTLPIDEAREWISTLSEDEAQARAVIKAIGVLGDPHAVNWLISKMEEPSLAKLAGESFAYITGVDLEKQQLVIDEPDNYPVIPADDTDDHHVELDEDENLPYPDVDKITTQWRHHGQNFIVGRRYFMGQIITPEFLKSTLTSGTQRQRHAAAMELALNESDVCLPNTCARVLP
ncbi:MAG: TIGR02270 family protein [Gammaproteobacteria bacterium]|nr:TIGR02270 family protein [Gammaproteobacteria bacterium]